MLEQMNDQVKNSMKPVTELAALNISTLQAVSEKQSALFTTLLNGGVSFAKTATEHKDIASFSEAQKEYLTSLQETVTNSAKETYTLVSEAQAKASEMFKGFSENFSTSMAVAK